jgi:hypothetical protein
MGGSPAVDLQGRFGDLVELSLEALPKMFDEETGIFCQKTVAEGDRLSNRGSNVFYSAMSTVGILRQSARPPESVFPLGKALDTLHGIAAAGAAPQVLANVVWALALAEDQRGAALARELAERDDLRGCESAALGHVIHGLAVAAEAYPEQSGRAIEACRRWAPELLARFSPQADLFGPFRRPTGVRSALIHRLTSFAAQVYPLHGLASFYRVTGEAPSPVLRRVAARLVAAQGPLGQWWWLYSTKTRAVLEGYPVYSVHQDGMAFMALLPVEALGEGSYREPLGLGLDWLFGANELSTSELVRRDPAAVFRNIQRVGSDADAMFGISGANLRRVIARSLRPGADHTHAEPAELEVLYESRPYHLGWLLHAYALSAE